MRVILRSLAVCGVLRVASAAFGEQVDNPEFVQWSKYKVGTFVTMKQATEMPGMAQMAAMMPQSSTTTKLTEVKGDSLTLEMTISTTSMGRSNETKTTRVVPAKIEKPTGVAATASATQPAGEIKDLKEGKETVEVKGGKVETTTREFTTTTSASAAMGGMGGGRGRGGAAGGAGGTETPMVAHMKIWSSAEVPNGLVKSEMTTTMEQVGEVKMTQTLVDYVVVK